MRNNFSPPVFVRLFAIFFTCTNALLAQTVLPENSQIKQINISESELATMKNGDYVYPKFSPDGKQLAYSDVLVEDQETTEVGVFDLQKQTKSILLSPKEAKKYMVYSAFVTELRCLGLNNLLVKISDGDVDSTSLIFDTQTRRVKHESHSSTGIEISEFTSPLVKILYRRFPKIKRDFINSAVNMHQAFEIGNRGAVIQYNHADTDSNIWFLNFQTKQPQLLLEAPPDTKDFNLLGAAEVNGTLLFIVQNKKETYFYRWRNEKVEQIGKTSLGGWFKPKFATPSKLVFLLKQINYEREKPGSLWYFDGKELSQVSDVEDLFDVDIDKTGRLIAFSYWNKAGKRDVSVREIKPAF